MGSKEDIEFYVYYNMRRTCFTKIEIINKSNYYDNKFKETTTTTATGGSRGENSSYTEIRKKELRATTQ